MHLACRAVVSAEVRVPGRTRRTTRLRHTSSVDACEVEIGARERCDQFFITVPLRSPTFHPPEQMSHPGEAERDGHAEIHRVLRARARVCHGYLARAHAGGNSRERVGHREFGTRVIYQRQSDRL